MKKVHQIFCRIDYLISGFYDAYWVHLDGGIKGAIIGALIAIAGIFLQNYQQRIRDDKQQLTTEQNKLRYLNFLIKDTYKVIEFYNSNAQLLQNGYTKNPFTIDGYIYYSPRSVEAIVNGINQEDYYLAVVKRLQDEGIGEVFLLYNALNQQLKDVHTHYYAEHPKMVDKKISYEYAVKDLRRNIRAYLQKTSGHPVSAGENTAFFQLNTLINSIDVKLSESIDSNLQESEKADIRTSRYKAVFIDPAIAILDAHTEIPALQKLLNEANDVAEKYRQCVIHKKNVVTTVLKMQPEINFEYKEIKRLTQPLEDYIKKLPKPK